MSRVIWAIVFVLSSISMAMAADVKTDGPFQIRYASNLNIGDSVVDITNSGASGATICANVYTFDPAEELISCCSCSVTPNALVSLSVQNDLISNPLTPAIPTSVVVKLLSTTGGACNAGTPAATATLATGLLAFGTTLHALPTSPVSYGVTETAFSPATLSATERANITGKCASIQSNGSGFGICASCRAGGLAPTQ